MIRIAQQVSRAIRILRGNRDESARASHLVVEKDLLMTYETDLLGQAEKEKSSQSTFFERKIMSTKTAFKRVALVAAAALAIGGVSAVSAYATPTAGQVTPTFPTSASAVTGTYTTVTLNAGSNDKYYTITSSGVGSVLYPSAPQTPDVTGLVSGASEVWYAGATPGAANFNAAAAGASTAASTDVLTFSVYSATAGTQTLTITGNSTAANTTTITWGAAAVLSAANSFVVANNATDIQLTAINTTAGHLKATSAGADSSISLVGTTPSALAGGATVGLYNNATTPAGITGDQISASVSGPGLLKIANITGISSLTSGYPTAGTSAATVGALSSAGRSVTAAAGQFAEVQLFADGTTGTATVTVSDSTAGVVLGTFTVTFYSLTIAKLTATVNNSVPLAGNSAFTSANAEGFAGANGAANTAPVTVVAADANGNAIPAQQAEIAVSSGTTTVATVAATPNWDATGAFYYPTITPVSEGKTVLTFTDVSTGLVVATATVTVAAAVVATLTPSSDAQSYDPGTKVIYTLTAADAAGKPVADGTYAALLSTLPTSNVGLQGSLPTANVTFTAGVANYTLYAPLATANVAIAGGVIGVSAGAANYASALDAAKLAEVDFATTGSSDTAANAATDAANAAADSADAATQAAQDAGDKADAALTAVTALSQQVTTLLAKVAALATTIAKIAKKVKA